MSTMSKVTAIQQCADAAYERQDQEWFDTAPLDHLAVLWGIACATLAGASWDDEVYDALAKRGWFDEPVSTA